MPNSINGVNTANAVAPVTSGQSSPTGSASPGNQTAPTAVDSVNVGGMEALLHSINAAADQVPTVDAGRVSQLQQAVAGGTYKIDPQNIAQKLLDAERQLGAKGGGQ